MQHYTLQDFSTDEKLDSLISTLCQKDIIEIQISYLSSFKSAKILRDIVDTICKSAWINPKWRTRLVLIIDEINNNAIEYGSLEGEINTFNLILKKENVSKFYIESYVSDTGNGSHWKTARDMQDLKRAHQNKDFSCHKSIRWRGLFLIISQLVDTLYFNDNENWGLTVGIQKVLEEGFEK